MMIEDLVTFAYTVGIPAVGYTNYQAFPALRFSGTLHITLGLCISCAKILFSVVTAVNLHCVNHEWHKHT